MNAPLLPKGNSRDDTQHGQLYFTLAQMREYGQACAEFALTEIDKSRMQHNASGQSPKGSYGSAVDELLSKMGMGK